MVIDWAVMWALDLEVVAMVCGRFGEDCLPYEHDGLGPLPRLSGMTASALGVLAAERRGSS